MGLSGEGEESVLLKFEEICLDLNMDATAKEEAWQNYQKMLTNYTLEGDQIHWLACALYEACRRMSTPTVGRGTMEGNCVSLTRLLRSSKLSPFHSLIQFFNKMRKWSDMANLPKSFRDKIDKLERNFAVSTVIFKKFEPIFLDIFVNPAQAQDTPRQPRGRKQRRSPCTSQEVFNFAWTLFIQVKGNFPAISDDLVNSYHLLLCCIDWIFANALLGGRKDLLNKDFEGLPSDFLSVNFRPGYEAPCIMQLLCDKHDGLVVEAKTIKEHWWKPFIKKLFEKKNLKGKFDNLSAVLEMGNFEENVKMINNLYEEYVLSVGDFDERIFLGEDAHEEIGTPGGQNTSDLTEQMAKRSLKQHFDETKTLTPSTPLTGRRYLKEKEACVTPVTTATQSVSRLQNLLSGCKTCPSAALTALFKKCSKNPSQEITQRVKEMGDIFCKHYAKQTEYPGASTDFARKRLHLGESLYFKTLEAIIEGEKQRLSVGNKKDCKSSLQGLLENDSFHRSLFACCLEIVIFSYNSQRTFPWIVDIFEFSSYQFYKVIEIIIRAEKGLSRDVVKHLNHIEESILESYAWKSDSPLWDAIKEDLVPSCEEVTPLSHMEGWRTGPPLPAKHKKLRSLVGTIKPVLQKNSELLSPGGGGSVVAAADRFSSPTPGNAKRRLFGVAPAAAVAVANSTTNSTFTMCAPSPSAGNSHNQVPVSSVRPVIVPPTPPPGVTVISTPNQLPGTSLATSATATPVPVSSQESGRSILLNQLTGGFTSSVVVPNKLANFLAPSTMSAKSGLSGVADPNSKEAHVASASSGLAQNDKSNSSNSSTATTSTSSTTTSVSSSSIASPVQTKTSTAGNQQAIVAVMEDGRQILIPLHIENPSVSSATTAGTFSTLANVSSGGTTSSSSSTTKPSSPSGTTTIVSIKKPGQGYCQVQVKLDRGVDIDHSYNKPKKTGSLSLFFRKVYHLASVRLRDLFDKLGIEDDALMKKIWTCFEYVMVHHARSLMCDRHLDQLIMCTIYLIAKVTENPQTFQDIMKCYRLQPQAHSHVYRSVLLSSRHRHGSASSDSSNAESGTSSPDAVDSNKMEATKDDKKKQPTVRSTSTLPHPQPNSQPPTPTKFVGATENFNFEEERGDLIQFYNLVFLKKIRDFAMKFMDKNTDLTDQPKLSPLPAGRCVTLSPRRVSNTLFISPAQGQGALTSSHNRSFMYSINHSPSKGAIKSAKRVLEVDQDHDSVNSPATKRRILTLNAGPVEPVIHPLLRRLQEMDQH
ncbi:retinoblastoma-like protein 1 [Plakobranchus ocellatus]|uniref:Retinoblastoma-like protein 1 n=1 Tax=Plakobranchus ocellatus TaxID=259542 RepID=A0AAV3Y8Z6_9GAST|nr:retinoblastoma-like protein 1 [Plakobranchus ocellatus]